MCYSSGLCADMRVIGLSGSGKSTLLNLLGGLFEPTAGKIAIGRVDITKLSTNDFRKCVYHCF